MYFLWADFLQMAEKILSVYLLVSGEGRKVDGRELAFHPESPCFGVIEAYMTVQGSELVWSRPCHCG